MTRVRRFLLRLRNVLQPGRAEQELAREMASHLGVMPGAFAFPDSATELWAPLVPASSGPNQVRLYNAIARVRDGVSIEAAGSAVRAIYAGLGRAGTRRPPASRSRVRHRG